MPNAPCVYCQDTATDPCQRCGQPICASHSVTVDIQGPVPEWVRHWVVCFACFDVMEGVMS